MGEEKKKPRSRAQESTLLKEFGQRLKALREKRGLTQVDLARAIGVHKMQLLRYEHGQSSPTAERVIGLARVLRVTADVLLRGDRKGEESIPFENIQLFERMRVLDRLPRSELTTVLDVIDAVIARHEMKGVVERRSATA
jgi:transcriptional regulator with XRE-family HTH domain